MKDEMIKTTNNKVYDLEERTTIFAENIILLCKKASKTAVSAPIIDQLVRSGTDFNLLKNRLKQQLVTFQNLVNINSLKIINFELKIRGEVI
jgi:hypothetical protein